MPVQILDRWACWRASGGTEARHHHLLIQITRKQPRDLVVTSPPLNLKLKPDLASLNSYLVQSLFGYNEVGVVKVASLQVLLLWTYFYDERHWRPWLAVSTFASRLSIWGGGGGSNLILIIFTSSIRRMCPGIQVENMIFHALRQSLRTSTFESLRLTFNCVGILSALQRVPLAVTLRTCKKESRLLSAH